VLVTLLRTHPPLTATLLSNPPRVSPCSPAGAEAVLVTLLRTQLCDALHDAAASSSPPTVSGIALLFASFDYI
jgi:hypothetical protein